MKQFVLASFLGVLMVLSGCKTSQVGSNGSSSSGNGGQGDKGTDTSAQAVFARDLPSFRITPEHTDAFESFANITREDPRSKPKTVGPVQSSNAVGSRLEYKLSMIKDARTRIDKVLGYRILLYSGTDASHANELKRELEKTFANQETKEVEGSLVNPDSELSLNGVEPTEIHFDYIAPNYIIKMGNYLSRMEAHHVYIQLKEAFPDAIVVSEAVSITRED